MLIVALHKVNEYAMFNPHPINCKHMKKCQELATVLAAEYAERSKNRHAPHLHLSIKEKNGEGYTSSYAGGKLSITANNLLAQTYAISQMGTAIQARHLAEYLGESSPRFSLRPLWLKAPIEVSLTDQLSLHLPEFMLAEDAQLLLPRLCKRLIECGYNSILIGTHQNNWELKEVPSTLTVDLNSLIQQLHDHGIQVILKPNFKTEISSKAPCKSKAYLEAVINELFIDFPAIDGLFWESLWQTPAYHEDEESLDLTDAEIALSEIEILESCIQDRSKLIFYMAAPNANKNEAARQAKWILSLLDDMKKNSILAFSAVVGSAFDDHAKDNPLWEILRESPDFSATALLPILNVGLVKQGEGLWPVTNFDLLERFLPRCSGHSFAGIVCTASHLPQAGSVLDCNLWVAGQSLWRSIAPSLLAETWFKAFRPEENPALCLQVMEKARSIALNLTAIPKLNLAADEAKIYGDSLMGNLRQLNWILDKEHCSSGSSAHPSIKDHFTFFSRDVKQLLAIFLPTYNLSLSFHSTHDEPTASFWSHELDTPHRGPKNSTMEAIYLENRYL